MQIVGDELSEPISQRLTAPIALYQYHQLRMDQEEETETEVNAEDANDTEPAKESVLSLDLCRKSIVLAFVFCLRLHLKTVYGATDQCVAYSFE